MSSVFTIRYNTNTLGLANAAGSIFFKIIWLNLKVFSAIITLAAVIYAELQKLANDRASWPKIDIIFDALSRWLCVAGDTSQVSFVYSDIDTVCSFELVVSCSSTMMLQIVDGLLPSHPASGHCGLFSSLNGTVRVAITYSCCSCHRAWELSNISVSCENRLYGLVLIRWSLWLSESNCGGYSWFYYGYLLAPNIYRPVST